MTDQNIINLNKYLSDIAKPLIDKLFFVDKVESKFFIDYGCADGLLLSALANLIPDGVMIGFDHNEDMLKVARKSRKNLILTSKWEDVEKLLSKKGDQKSCVILSSIMHEVYAYGSKKDVDIFFDRIWGRNNNIGFDEVVFRDMMVNRATSRPSDPIVVARIRQVYNPKKIAEWEALWGGLGENWSLNHFLLTYRYDADWEREMRENYLPIPLETFLSNVPNNYYPIYMEHFQPPFQRRATLKDLKVSVPDSTHLKAIFERS